MRRADMITTIATKLLAVLALAGAAGAIAYVTGEATADPPLHWSRGYDSGFRAGARDAAKRAAAKERRDEARYAPGHPGYEPIFAAGRREGYRAGRDDGLAAGRRSALRSGALIATGIPGGWRPEHWYIVRIDPGPPGAPPRVTERIEVSRNALYGACAQDPSAICDEPLPRR